MKLLACQVENFGKLSDYSVVFSEGLNTIIEDNGWGKTTLAAFLKAMLYGLDPKKEPGAYDKERVMYRPWQGGTYGGTLDFEVGTKSYRVSRTFGRTEKADEFRLYDLATMLESRDYSASLGTEIFDLDSTSFKRSVFIGQSDCAFMPTDSISAKLGNLAENTNDINNYESAYGNIKDALNRLTPNRATGSIRRRQQLMAQLDAEISSLDAAQDGYSRIRVMRKEKIDEKEALSAQREGLAQALKDASEKSAVLEKRASYNALLAEEQQAADNCKKYEEKFPAGVPTEEDLRKFTGTVRQMAEVEATIRNLCSEDADAQEYERLRERFGDTPPDKATVASYIEENRASSVNEDRLAELKNEQEEQRRPFEVAQSG
ncbi:MAG: AAA family ATPase, partial [Clostridiales bacterium]|nr:AAA family ATPase [Clostridiales bacterium]